MRPGRGARRGASAAQWFAGVGVVVPVLVELEVATANVAATPIATMAEMVDPTPAPPVEAPTPCDAPPAAPTVTPTAWATCTGSRAGVWANASTAKTSETNTTGKVFFTCAPFSWGSKNRTTGLWPRFQGL